MRQLRTGIARAARREASEGFHLDEHAYHLGLVTYDGVHKPANVRCRELMREGRREVAVAGPPGAAEVGR